MIYYYLLGFAIFLFLIDAIAFKFENTKLLFSRFLKKENISEEKQVEQKIFTKAKRFDEVSEYKKLLIKILDDISFSGYKVAYDYNNWYIEEGISGSIIVKKKLSNYRDISLIIGWEIKEDRFKVMSFYLSDISIKWVDDDIHKYLDLIYSMYVSLETQKDKTIIDKYNKFKSDIDSALSNASKRDSKINDLLGE